MMFSLCRFTLFLSLLICICGFSQDKNQKILIQSSQQLLDKGVSLYEKGNYKQAILLFENASAIAKKKNEYNIEAMSHNNWGNTLALMGKSDDAMKHYLIAHKILQKNNNSLNSIKILKNIGALYSEQKDFHNALLYYYKALSYSESINNKILIADCYNNIAVVFDQQEKYHEALNLYEKALFYYTEENAKQRIGMTLNNMAIVYKFLKNYTKSIEYYEKSLAISEEEGDFFMLAANQNNLGNVYAEVGNYPKSLQLCFLANKNAKHINALEIIVESLDGISFAYEKMGQFSKALEYRKIYEKTKDNFINTERSTQISSLKIKYETEEKENKIKLLEQQQKINNLKLTKQKLITNRKNYFIVVGVLFVTIVGIYTYFLFRKERKIAEERKLIAIKETEEQERNRVAQDIHDDFGSGLSKIRFLTDNMGTVTSMDEKSRLKIQEINRAAYDLVDTMRDLIWMLPSDNNTLKNLFIRIREFSGDYFQETSITTNIDIPEIIPDIKLKNEVTRNLLSVIKEIMQNVIKHSDASIFDLHISFDNNHLIIVAKDDGKGFNMNENHVGNGLRNMKRRVHTVGGMFQIRNQEGTTIIIDIELSKLSQI